MTERSRLRQTYTGTADEIKTIFIIVPGIGTLSPDQWVDDSGASWLTTAGKPATAGLAVHVFEPKLTIGGALPWEQIEEEGAQLLAEIQSLTETAPSATCPLVMVAHSLGGLVLKRALCIAHRQQRWQDLLKHVAGVMLISCPHSRSDDSRWERVSMILKAFSKSRHKHPVSSEMASLLATDCVCFEREFSQKPVFSVHEELETLTGRMRWHKDMLVDEAFAHPRVNGITQGVKTDHNHSACLKNDRNLTSTVHDFLTRIVNKTRKDINFEALFQYERPQGLEESTNASQTEAELGNGYSSGPHWLLPTAASRPPRPSPAAGQSETSDMLPSTAPSQDARASLPEIFTAKDDPKLPCLVMPHDPNPSFHGRRDTLAQVANALIPASGPVLDTDTTDLRCFAISGPGGIGKTQVAVQFVWDHKSSFDAIFWVYAASREKLNLSFARIAVALGLVAEVSVEAQDMVLTRGLVLGWLARPLKSSDRHENERAEEASWLVIYDNAEDPALLDDFWPRSSTGSVMITSRVPLPVLQFYSGSHGMVLTPFDHDETTGFLLKITHREQDVEDRKSVGAIAEILGGLPLATASMAGSILRRDLTFAEFLQEYKDPRTHAELFRQPIGNQRAQGYEHTMLSVWGLENLKYGAALLDVLSFLDPDGIPEYVLEAHDADIDDIGFPRSRRQYGEARAELLQSSLVSRDRTAKKLVIHRLIQDTVRARMTDERYSTVFVSALQLVSRAWPYEGDFGFIKDETYRSRQCTELYKHVLHLQKLSVRLTPPKNLTKAHVQPPRLFLEAAWLSIMRAEYSHTTSLIDTAEAMCKPLKEDEEGLHQQDDSVRDEFEQQLFKFYYQRGVLRLNTHDTDTALVDLKEFARLLQERLGGAPEHRLGVALNELGVAYLQKTESTKSEDCFRKSIDMFTHLGTTTPNAISMPLINLGFCLWVQNRLEEAASTFKRALTIRETAYGINDTKSFALGKLFLGLGNVMAAQGNLDESYTMHERCLTQYRATVGPFHHRTGDGCVRVADHYVRKNRLSEALGLLDHASRIFGAASHFRPEQARVRYRRSKVLNAMGKSEDARASAIEALKLYRLIQPDDDLRELETLTDADFDERATFMIGGALEYIHFAMPVLRAMSRWRFVMGPVGSGHTMKTFSNYITAAGIVALNDCLIVGAKMGLDPAQMTDVLNVGTGRNYGSSHSTRAEGLTRKYACGFGLALMVKDLDINLSLFKRMERDTQLAERVHALFSESMEVPGVQKNADETEVLKYWESRAGFQLRTSTDLKECDKTRDFETP